MQSTLFNLQKLQQAQLHRIDDPNSNQSYYIQVRSKDFEFNDFDKGTYEQRVKYNITPDLNRYYMKRKFLFSRFEQDIQLDRESWFSVIPQNVSLYLRQRFVKAGYKKIFQPFCGAGGIAIHLCDVFQQYRVNDIDQKKIDMLKHNMGVYQKSLKSLQYHTKDFLEVKAFETDLLIVCPPWGNIKTEQYSYKDLDKLMKPKLSDIFKHCLKFSSNIMLQMPKQTNVFNLIKVISQFDINPCFSIEKILTNGKNSQLFFYFGDQKFTGIEKHYLLNHIYEDLQLIDSKQKKKIKKKYEKSPHEVMQQIFEYCIQND